MTTKFCLVYSFLNNNIENTRMVFWNCICISKVLSSISLLRTGCKHENVLNLFMFYAIKIVDYLKQSFNFLL